MPRIGAQGHSSGPPPPWELAQLGSARAFSLPPGAFPYCGAIRPPEIRIANPEIRFVQGKPFVMAQPEPFKIEPGQVTVKVEQQPPATSGVGGNTKTATGEIIEREVTVFSNVRHGPGVVVTGWSYRDGSGGVPIHQYCYYTAPNIDHSSKRVDIASNRVRSSNIDAGVVPDPEGALAKCQWWQA